MSTCLCTRKEGQAHSAGCAKLALDYANAIQRLGVFRARNSGLVDGATGRPVDESLLFQSVATRVDVILRDRQAVLEMGMW